MINILSYVGMNMQSEVCLWTLLGLMRTIFDATLFKVNSNLKQVWQMSMPQELSLPVQRALRTVISGVMLVQCFTVYVYLASYIVLLYPVFLEERPTLVLPWLLLAAVRKLLCELTSLSLGLGTCVLLGPARPPCIKFLIVKVVAIMPAFYMWMLIFSYYHALKVASAFKTFPVLPSTDLDYGLELAVRRRRTKSLLGEDQLRRKLEASFYNDRNVSLIDSAALQLPSPEHCLGVPHSEDTSVVDKNVHFDALQPISGTSNRISDSGAFEEWFDSEVVIPRDTDRILEQLVLMLLRISVYLRKDGNQGFGLQSSTPRLNNVSIRTDLDCPVMPSDTDTPTIVRNRQENRPSYLRDYPEMFTRKSSDIPLSARKRGSIKTVQTKQESHADGNVKKEYKRAVTINSNEMISLEIQRVVSRKTNGRKRNSTVQPNVNKTDEKSNGEERDFSEKRITQNTDDEESKNGIENLDERVEKNSPDSNSRQEDSETDSNN